MDVVQQGRKDDAGAVRNEEPDDQHLGQQPEGRLPVGVVVVLIHKSYLLLICVMVSRDLKR
ncbi:hypothetical protein D9M69_724320 [compost metagenome]